MYGEIDMSKGIIYYTDNRLDEPIFSAVQKQLLKSGLPIVSCSLKPMAFGTNVVLDLSPGPTTMFEQILAALKASEAESVFFCEHDVLYHPTHFDFTPPKKDVFYYNTNVWRWDWGGNRVITFDNFQSVSGLCVNREKAIENYEKRLKIIYEKGYDRLPTRGNPDWARKMGYEPGKPKRIGGFSDESMGYWRSAYPNIDIRHQKTMTPRKMTLESFVHKPVGWREAMIDELPGWNLRMSNILNDIRVQNIKI